MKVLLERLTKQVGLSTAIIIDGDCVVLDGWIYISECKVIRKSIKGDIEVDGWKLEKAVPVPGTYDYPEDVDIEVVAEQDSGCCIAKKAVLTIVEWILDKELFE